MRLWKACALVVCALASGLVAAQGNELVFGDYRRRHLPGHAQGDPRQVRADRRNHRQGHGAARAHAGGARLRRGARGARQAGIRPGLHPSGARLDGRDQGQSLQGGGVDERVHRVHRVDPRRQGLAAEGPRRAQGPHAGDARSRLDHRGDGAGHVPRRRRSPPIPTSCRSRARCASSPRATRTPCRSISRTALPRPAPPRPMPWPRAGPRRAARWSIARAPCPSSNSSCRTSCRPTRLQKIREALLTLRDPKALEVVGYKGFVAPNPDVESSTIAWLGL